MNADIDILVVLVFFILGVLAGNLVGDSQTFQDCAVRGEAKMLSGGTIACTVNKEPLK